MADTIPVWRPSAIGFCDFVIMLVR